MTKVSVNDRPVTVDKKLSTAQKHELELRKVSTEARRTGFKDGIKIGEGLAEEHYEAGLRRGVFLGVLASVAVVAVTVAVIRAF